MNRNLKENLLVYRKLTNSLIKHKIEIVKSEWLLVGQWLLSDA